MIKILLVTVYMSQTPGTNIKVDAFVMQEASSMQQCQEQERNERVIINESKMGFIVASCLIQGEH